jgi:hypothetical protein
MARDALVRPGGVAAIVGGILRAAASFAPGLGSDFEQQLLYLVVDIFLLLGLLSFYELRYQEVGRTGAFGFLMALVPSVDTTNAVGTQTGSAFTRHAHPHNTIKPPTKARAPSGYRSSPGMTRLDLTTSKPRMAVRCVGRTVWRRLCWTRTRSVVGSPASLIGTGPTRKSSRAERRYANCS